MGEDNDQTSSADTLRSSRWVAGGASPRRRVPSVTLVLIATNVLVYLAVSVRTGDWILIPPVAAIHWGANFGPATLSGEWWRLLTAMFLHAGLWHLASNMCLLAICGPKAERLFGSARYALLYLSTGSIGNVMTLWWHPWAASAGASGAIFGVIGGLFALAIRPAARAYIRTNAILLTIASALVLLGFVGESGQITVDTAAHVGGLIAGLIMGWLLTRPLDRTLRRGQPARLALGMGLAAVSIVALAWPLARRPPLSRAEIAFCADVLRVGAQANPLRDFQLEALMVRHDLAPASWSNDVVTKSLSACAAMEDRIEHDVLPPGSSLAPPRAALLGYLDERRQALDLLQEAVRSGNASERASASGLLTRSEVDALRFQRVLASTHAGRVAF